MSKKYMIIVIGVLLVFIIGVCTEKYFLLSQGLSATTYVMLGNISTAKEIVFREINQLIYTVKITSAILLGIFTSSNVKSQLFGYKK